ncbi:M48 family metallopeptidase [Nocardioides campestrisoli]|uniref:M48 family metallopeptidase n=1 Tax=Nocardioides campestrisoli TaxID=2736757 RepID=UPI00163DABEE|nr:M48 family metallopeptidase [Nocardioides campestrisoli]
MTQTPVRSRTPLPGISSRAWEHPADAGALVALRKLKGFDSVLKAMSGLISERTVRLMLLGSSVRADERQFPVLHRLLHDVGVVLDADTIPELYVRAAPTFGAVAVGMEKPVIVVDSGLVQLLDEEEMRFVLGHELGHVLSGHAVYQTLLQRLLGLTGVFAAVPGGSLGLRGIVAALMEWSRKAELSADRAGLLAAQNPAAATRVHMKLASGGDLEHLDPTSFFAQAHEYTETEDLRDSVLKVFLVEQQSHPFAVVRASELRRWTESGAYTEILAGRFPLRSEDDQAKVSDAAKAAAASYSETFRRSQDALGRLVHEAAGFVGSARIWLDGKLRNA